MSKQKFSAGIGIPSILLIFIIMALMTFGILSVVTVRSDKKLTDLTAEKSSEYYQALGQSQKLLAIADDAVAKASYKTSGDKFEKELKDNLKNTGITANSYNGVINLEWSVKVNSQLVIKTVAEVGAFGYDGKNLCQIISNKLETIGEWQGDDRHLDVYGG